MCLVHYEWFFFSNQRFEYVDEQVCVAEHSLQEGKCRNAQIHFLTVTENWLKGVVPRWDVCWAVEIFENTGGRMDWQQPSTATWQQGRVGGKALWLSDAAGAEKTQLPSQRQRLEVWVHRLHLSSVSPESVWCFLTCTLKRLRPPTIIHNGKVGQLRPNYSFQHAWIHTFAILTTLCNY